MNKYLICIFIVLGMMSCCEVSKFEGCPFPTEKHNYGKVETFEETVTILNVTRISKRQRLFHVRLRHGDLSFNANRFQYQAGDVVKVSYDTSYCKIDDKRVLTFNRVSK